MSLNRRQRAVLREVVLRYIRKGRPVSSADVARSPAVGLAAATVRLVMAELKEAGLLEQPHRSAGSVPTDQGLRVFLDAEKGRYRLEGRRRARLTSQLAARRRELVEDLEWVARVLSDITKTAGVVVRPIDRERRLEAVSLLRLSGSRALGVVVTGDGAIERRVIEIGPGLGDEDLGRMARYLNREYRGMELTRILKRLDEAPVQGMPERLAALAKQLFAGLPEDVEIAVAGTRHLAAAEDLAGGEALRCAFSVLEDRDRIIRTMRRLLEKDRTRVIIGHESEITARGNLGMVASVFSHEGRRVGAVGVLGPRRMDYPRILPVVEFVGMTLTRMLNGTGAGDHAGTSHG